MRFRAKPFAVITAVLFLSLCTQASSQQQVHRCVLEERVVFQEAPCPSLRSPDPVVKPASAHKRPDAEALRAEQARRREELQKGFREVQEIPAPTSDSSRSVASPSPQSTSVIMAFEDCIRTIQQTAAQMGAAPRNIVETPDIRMVRINTIDGSVLVTCSRADRKMVTTVSPK
jgi:hypothetical protein